MEQVTFSAGRVLEPEVEKFFTDVTVCQHIVTASGLSKNARAADEPTVPTADLAVTGASST